MLSVAVQPPGASGSPPPPPAAAPAAADVFQYPLPTWSPHCLGFGSQWRYCNGVPLRACPSGAVWLHTGADVQTGIQPVVAAGDGVIVGYQTDPTFRGGVLIRHQTSAGVVITQYWHVWLRSGFGVGTPVKRGQAFADVADMAAARICISRSSTATSSRTRGTAPCHHRRVPGTRRFPTASSTRPRSSRRTSISFRSTSRAASVWRVSDYSS